MDISMFETGQLDVVFRVLRTAACVNEPISSEARAFLEAYQSIVGYPGGIDRIDSIDPIDPIDVVDAAATPFTPHQRKRLVQLASVAAMVHRPVRRASAEYVEQLARALDSNDPVVPVLDALSRNRHGRARVLSARRMFRVILKENYAAEGLLGVLRFFGALFFKFAGNKSRLWNYKRLGLLPEGTLGREFWKHMTRTGFGFPGERGGIPQPVAYHDVGHVLTGYSTQPEGEFQQGAFQAGNRREDGFVFLQFVLLQFHQGVRITPITKAETGLFDPQKVLFAVQRGAQTKVDITHDWNFWDLMPKSLEQARRELNVGAPL